MSGAIAFGTVATRPSGPSLLRVSAVPASVNYRGGAL
jgi:hypothetical protein